MRFIKFLIKSFIFLLWMNVCQSSPSSKYVIGHWAGGLAVSLTSALNHLLYCENKNLTPVIFWNRSLYWDEKGFNNNTTNEWEYYFEPVSDLKRSPGDIVNSFCTSPLCGHFSYHHTPRNQEQRNLAHKLINKYVKPNSIVMSKIKEFYIRYMEGKQNIGIHIRGTDKYTEEKPVEIPIVVAEALKYDGQNTQFFIATDEKRILENVVNLLKDKKVIYYNCYRSEDGKPLHFKSKSKPSPAQLGEDVVVEMWLMAKCNVLVHTLSNVSSIPLYLNNNLIDVPLRAE